jgi:hypothetical protein
VDSAEITNLQTLVFFEDLIDAFSIPTGIANIDSHAALTLFCSIGRIVPWLTVLLGGYVKVVLKFYNKWQQNGTRSFKDYLFIWG